MSFKIKVIKDRNDIKPGMYLLEVLYNSCKDSDYMKDITWLYQARSFPYQYGSRNDSNVLSKSYVVDIVSKIYDKDWNADVLFLADAGINDKGEQPHNNHVLYQIINGDFFMAIEEIKKMKVWEFKRYLAENTYNPADYYGDIKVYTTVYTRKIYDIVVGDNVIEGLDAKEIIKLRDKLNTIIKCM